MRKVYLLFPVLLFLVMCKNDDIQELDCAAVLCAADYSELYIEVIDRNNDENVFANGTYTIDDISIDGTESVGLKIDSTTERELLIVSDSIWDMGAFEYHLMIGEANVYKLLLDLERSGGDGCCSNTLFLQTLEINDVDQNVQSGQIISVFVN